MLGGVDTLMSRSFEEVARLRRLRASLPVRNPCCYTAASEEGCGCFNWTLRAEESGQRLQYQVSMAGSPFHQHSKHVWATLERIPYTAPVDFNSRDPAAISIVITLTGMSIRLHCPVALLLCIIGHPRKSAECWQALSSIATTWMPKSA